MTPVKWITSLVAMILLEALIVASQAHQDPCHRLHSCSDLITSECLLDNINLPQLELTENKA
jgi:hypothetical protein